MTYRPTLAEVYSRIIGNYSAERKFVLSTWSAHALLCAMIEAEHQLISEHKEEAVTAK